MPLTNIKYTRIPIKEMKDLAKELISELNNINSRSMFIFANWNRVKKLISDLQFQVLKAEKSKFSSKGGERDEAN